jgi:sarcosine oxidase subunit beta
MKSKNTAEVIIIGAGVIGTSIAYHLAKAGCSDVIILDKGAIGEGSTAKCTGGVRVQFSQEVNIRLSMESVKFFEHFEEETGYPSDFRQYGYLMLANSEDTLDTFHHNLALQSKLGAKISIISPKETREIVPQLNTTDVIGATYCPTDGFLDPWAVVQGFARAAREMGVRIYTDTNVTAIIKTGKLIQLITNAASFKAPLVVNATGAYAGLVGKMLGVNIPVRPSKQQTFISAPTENFPPKAPLVIDVEASLGIRREGSSLLFTHREPNALEGFDESVDWGHLSEVGELLQHRFPSFSDLGIMRAQAGLKSNTPDMSAILGRVTEVEEFYLACGLSGHGLMHSPAVGKWVAADILGNEHNHLISLLSLNRFRSNKLVEETH